MKAQLRKAKAADIPEILSIVNHAIRNSTANYLYDDITLEEQLKWFEEKQSKNFPIVVAILDQKVVGFGTYGTFREKIGYQFTVEHSVYVAENCIGKGIGSLLLTELIALAKSEGYHVMIGGIDAANHESIAFHKKFGFTENGILKEVGFKFGKWLDLQLMQLILK
ncbi:N-acetyltransferase [Flavobacterium sp. CYK-4]|uniref:GNAT family N-acetyltransferase n=1 Tax=Flavobacterium lotistagni TaxID=2709660 RepID=UPI001408B990|nr:GNAT family N-acetyltransferase [Flavobacterium lotistagni]NHM07722.1 N-acetyltransferase [Flavobacterium lotistagni]